MVSSLATAVVQRAPWLRWAVPTVLAVVIGAPVVGYGLGHSWAVAFLFESAATPSQLLFGVRLPLAAIVLLYSLVAGIFAMLALDELLFP